MNKKIRSSILLLFLLVSFFILVQSAKASKEKHDGSWSASCYGHPNRMWAWSLESAWMSSNATGDIMKDNWFYLIPPGNPLAILKIDGNGYYLACIEVGDELPPLFGLVRKETILLQSNITPSP